MTVAEETSFGSRQVRPQPDWASVGRVLRLMHRFPKTTLVAEFSVYGPVLLFWARLGGGVGAFQDGLDRDDDQFIPAYRKAIMGNLPAWRRQRMTDWVGWAVRHDIEENGGLRRALQLMSPEIGSPDPHSATVHTKQAAVHAGKKFLLLAAPIVLATGNALYRTATRSRPVPTPTTSIASRGEEAGHAQG